MAVFGKKIVENKMAVFGKINSKKIERKEAAVMF